MVSCVGPHVGYLFVLITSWVLVGMIGGLDMSWLHVMIMLKVFDGADWYLTRVLGFGITKYTLFTLLLSGVVVYLVIEVLR